MGSILADGADWLARKMQEHVAHVVTYRRGSLGQSVPATVARTMFDVQTAHGMIERYESRDFIFRASEWDSLIWPDSNTTPVPLIPVRGDQIDDKGVRYEVTAPAGEPCFEYGDAYRETYRIHTKKVGAVP